MNVPFAIVYSTDKHKTLIIYVKNDYSRIDRNQI